MSESHCDYLGLGAVAETSCFTAVIEQREYILCEVRSETEGTVDLRTYNRTLHNWMAA